MPDTFILRPMTTADGEAVRHLMEDDPETSGMQITTRFRVDPVTAWKTLKPNMVGAVATEGETVLGAATVAFEDVKYNGRVLPSAFLENLKVQQAARGKGVGSALAQWRVDQARNRFAEDGVIVTHTSTDNIASQNTMKKWANQFFSPLTLAIRPILRRKPPDPTGLSVHAAEERDYEEIAARSNRFYEDFQLYSVMSPDWLQSYIDPAPHVYGYFVVRDASGAQVAGAMTSLRAALMYDEIRRMPRVLKLVNDRLLNIVPSDGMLRSMEVNFLWYERLDAGRYLWNTLRWMFRDQVGTVTANFDARSRLHDAFQVNPWHMPKISVVVALHGPEMMDTSKPVCGTLRG